MSFTTKVKEEIVSKKLSETENYSILAGFIRNNATWNEDKLELINENEKIITYFKDILDMFKEIKYTEYTKDSNNFSKNNLCVSTYHLSNYFNFYTQILMFFFPKSTFLFKSYNL